jgi:hypothetical protein
MAMRAWLSKGIDSMVPRLTLVQGQFTSAGAGAVTGVKGTGVTSVTRRGAGLYDIVLDDTYARFLSGNISIVAVSAGTAVLVNGDAYDADPNNTSDGVGTASRKVKLQFVTGSTGALGDPASGCIVYFDLLLRNSAIKGKGE